ncbi:Inhibitor of vertebrate lysozyme (Ivy) [Bradyrhizobium sp. YR681]|uniref:Ivy family c-type lysozyme inhibitor n=1 Tax=Bradyrhizobium sp. YR681 TaxID=1144344 RepID=UPI000271481E|nr:Ivy family c-type lysozyme inhibitor [Bradyrhizobium sp. YR681]EJN15798.1 Inhibitor of vertebrate lysozyme (Ivy) [Bradyrhizobium sp. YR681]
MRRQFRWIVMAAALVTMCVAYSPAMAIGYLSGVLNKPAYVQTLTKLLDDAPAWTREILKRNGAYASSVRITTDIAGTSYELFGMCVSVAKCSDTSIVVMFAPNATQAWAGLNEKGVVSFLGSPSDAQQAVLKRQLYVAEPPPKVTTPFLFDVLKKPAYAQASKILVEHAGKLPRWARDVLAQNDVAYNSTPAELVDIDGVTYEVFTVCAKEYSCANTHLAVMFAPNGTQAWGVLVHEGVMSYLGAPSGAQAAVMRGELDPDDRKWGVPAGK